MPLLTEQLEITGKTSHLESALTSSSKEVTLHADYRFVSKELPSFALDRDVREAASFEKSFVDLAWEYARHDGRFGP